MKYLLIFIFLVFSFAHINAQTTLSFEFQAYPTGMIPGLRVENQISEKSKVHLRAGFNIFNHRDLGVQDAESGWGYGFTLGASRKLSESKFALGIKNDIWFNTVNWEDTFVDIVTTGETKITVIQPTAELTYDLSFKNLNVRPSLAFGLEWNVKTEGEPTGEGPIVLLGFIVGRK